MMTKALRIFLTIGVAILLTAVFCGVFSASYVSVVGCYSWDAPLIIRSMKAYASGGAFALWVVTVAVFILIGVIKNKIPF